MAQAFVYVDTVGWQALSASQLPNSGVTAATYGDATHVGTFTVTAQGIISSASNTAITGFSGPVTVTDGTHPQSNVTTIDFTSGATVSSGGAGQANVAISGSSSPLTTKGDIFGHSTVDARIPVGTDGQILTADSSNSLGVSWGGTFSGTGGGLGVYGDGSDGGQTYDGSTTILGMAPVASVYTLTRDIFLASSTINNGVTIIPNGFRIFCQGTLTNNGTISWNGASTSASAGGSTTSNSNSTISSANIGSSGASGGSGVGANGTAATSVITYGAQGGSGGAGTPNAGGNGGTTIAAPAKIQPIRFLPNAVLLNGISGDNTLSNTNRAGGGTGGGAGGGDGTNNGFGGGAGGGIVVVVAKTFAGTGVIQARGGNGGSPSVGNTGGGGGGGGGLVVIVSSSVSGGAVSGQTIDANGGTHGNGHGTGSNGNNGNNGTVIYLPN